jgi:hypothetical protein
MKQNRNGKSFKIFMLLQVKKVKSSISVNKLINKRLT